MGDFILCCNMSIGRNGGNSSTKALNAIYHFKVRKVFPNTIKHF